MPLDGKPGPRWPDRRLVEACLGGNEAAWEALVDRYKNLVYSIVLKYGPTSEEAADLFQGVWLDAYHDLPGLRRKEKVRSWLISLVTHKCYHWKKKKRRQEFHEGAEVEVEILEESLQTAPDFVEELERDQLVREAIFALPERCQEMVHLLFFAQPPLPYKEVAEKLGLAVGSIGFIRGRCLEKLQKNLEKLGF